MWWDLNIVIARITTSGSVSRPDEDVRPFAARLARVREWSGIGRNVRTMMFAADATDRIGERVGVLSSITHDLATTVRKCRVRITYTSSNVSVSAAEITSIRHWLVVEMRLVRCSDGFNVRVSAADKEKS